MSTVPRLLTAAALLLAPLVVAPAPAHATVAPTGSVHVWIVTDGFTTCAEGNADALGNMTRQWHFAISGARDDGTRIQQSHTDFGLAFTPPCVVVFTTAPATAHSPRRWPTAASAPTPPSSWSDPRRGRRSPGIR